MNLSLNEIKSRESRHGNGDRDKSQINANHHHLTAFGTALAGHKPLLRI